MLLVSMVVGYVELVHFRILLAALLVLNAHQELIREAWDNHHAQNASQEKRQLLTHNRHAPLVILVNSNRIMDKRYVIIAHVDILLLLEELHYVLLVPLDIFQVHLVLLFVRLVPLEVITINQIQLLAISVDLDLFNPLQVPLRAMHVQRAQLLEFLNRDNVKHVNQVHSQT